MTKEEFANLERGNIVTHKMTGKSYVLEGTCPLQDPLGDQMHIGVRTIIITNSHEWDLFKKK